MSEQPTTRRAFLQGRSAAEALASAGQGRAEVPLAQPQATLTLNRRAMACDFEVRLNATSSRNDTTAAMAALDVVEALEDRLTVYRTESEVQHINRYAAKGPVTVEDDVFALLRLADKLYYETNGAYDITSGPLSRAWGFSRRAGRVPTDHELTEALKHVGWDKVQIEAEQHSVEFTAGVTDINFNSVGKGFALDRAAEVLTSADVDSFLMQGGRSTLVARGKAADGHDCGWGVGLRHPLRPEQRLAECRLVDAAFSTSGSATQGFTANGVRYGHLIDPRTGRPASGLHSVSVLAPTGAEADALSTALYTLGSDAGADYCRARPDIQALFVGPSDKAGSVRIQGVHLDDSCWRLSHQVEMLR